MCCGHIVLVNDVVEIKWLSPLTEPLTKRDSLPHHHTFHHASRDIRQGAVAKADGMIGVLGSVEIG